MPPCGKQKSDGSTCQQPEGWGRDSDEGPCKYHADDGGSGESDDQRARDADDLPYDDAPFGRLTVERILDALRDGATFKIAAESAGVSERTFLRWRNSYPSLDRRVQRAKAESARSALSELQKAANNGDTATLRWLLEKRHGYDTGGGGVSEEDLEPFVDAVKGVLREELPDSQANDLIVKIGDELMELSNG
jgi:hypothetical protein